MPERDSGSPLWWGFYVGLRAEYPAERVRLLRLGLLVENATYERLALQGIGFADRALQVPDMPAHRARAGHTG